MDARDTLLVEQLIPENTRLQALWNEHLELERVLDDYAGRSYLTPFDEAEAKRLKRRKLLGKDEIFKILSTAR